MRSKRDFLSGLSYLANSPLRLSTSYKGLLTIMVRLFQIIFKFTKGRYTMENITALGIIALLALGVFVILTGNMTFVTIFMAVFGG